MAGGLFVDAALEPGERLRFRRVALLHRGRRTIGGEVNVTDRRLVFVPNRLEQLVGVRPTVVALGDVVRVDVRPAPVGSERFRFLPRTPRPRALVAVAEGDPVEVQLDDATALAALLGPPADG